MSRLLLLTTALACATADLQQPQDGLTDAAWKRLRSASGDTGDGLAGLAWQKLRGIVGGESCATLLWRAGRASSDFRGAPYGKLQVLMPRPSSHAPGSSEVAVGARELCALARAAWDASPETWAVVAAQLLSRLPLQSATVGSHPLIAADLQELKQVARLGHFEVLLPRLEAWRGRQSWVPHRQRNESYALEVEANRLVVDVSSSWALSNAMATLYQLMALRTEDGHASVSIPQSPHRIVDRPAHPHRGMLLDVARTFYPVPWLKTLIGALAEFKLNVLHLHLTDTSSWPIEIEGHPEITELLAYKDLDGKPLVYTRAQVRELVEYARVRGVMLMPEIDGPAHAPALASLPPLNLTVAASVNFSTWAYAYEPPPGTWDISSQRALAFVREAMGQVLQDFSTSPYLHLGGDEPVAGSMCETLADDAQRALCAEQCRSRAPGCEVVQAAPPGADANLAYWFPEALNRQAQRYFDEVTPSEPGPVAVWSGAVVDMGVQLPSDSSAKSALQLWQWPSPVGREVAAVTEQDCERFDLLQSSARYPQWADSDQNSTVHLGWLYLECGSGANWVSLGPNYWCPRAAWAAMYSQDIKQGYGRALSSPACQSAFVGGEIALWGEITGPGNSMALTFPRAVAWAERLWSDPAALRWNETAAGLGHAGVPPIEYFDSVLKEALARMNSVVTNFNELGLEVSRLQPEFCRLHPEYCTQYSRDFFASTQLR